MAVEVTQPDRERAGVPVDVDLAEVLVALCRPMASGMAFAQPATVRQLAQEFVVSEAAIKAHLANLYDKFGIYEAGESRRVRLANEAIRRRAVSLADLRTSP